MLNNFCFHVYAQMSLSHSHTLSFTPDMLNNFCFHVYSQKWLFIGENDNCFYFGTSSSTTTRAHHRGVIRSNRHYFGICLSLLIWAKSRNLIWVLGSDWTTQTRLRDFPQNENRKAHWADPKIVTVASNHATVPPLLVDQSWSWFTAKNSKHK